MLVNIPGDFFQIPFIKYTIDAIIKIVITLILSGIIGFEREHSHRPAGVRTHILVSISSCLVAITDIYVTNHYVGTGINADPTRLAAQIFAGIGFLGAGTILREGFNVKGLTTAASLLAVACIGVAVGFGYFPGAILATLGIYITLNSLKKVMTTVDSGKILYIELRDGGGLKITEITSLIRSFGNSVKSMEVVFNEKRIKLSKKNDTTTIKAIVFPTTEEGLNLAINALRQESVVVDVYVD